MQTKADPGMTLTSYNPENLLDSVIERLNLKNDAALCRHLDVPPALISKIRHHKLPVGASLLIRMHEATDLSIGELRSLIETPPDGMQLRRPQVPPVAKAPVAEKANLRDALTSFSKAVETIREPLFRIALLQCAQERYPDSEERATLMAEYRRLLDASESAAESCAQVASSRADAGKDEAAHDCGTPCRRTAARIDVERFVAAHPWIKELYHCLHSSP